MPPANPTARRYDAIEPRLRTGDIFLFHGNSAISRKIENATHSKFSHCAMVIRPDISKRPYLWQTGPIKIVKDRFTRTDHGGAQLGYLREAIDLMASPQYGDMPTWRQLKVHRTRAFETMAQVIVKDIDGRPFPSLKGMLRDWQDGAKHVMDSDRTLFCAELVAETLMRMGILPFDLPPNGYAPATFSMKNRKLRLRKSAVLGPEVPIIPPAHR